MAVLSTASTDAARRHRRWFRRGLVLFVMLVFGELNLPAQAAISKAYQIKAVFLFNFTQFVDWPTNVLTDPQTPFTIGVLGNDPFGNFLDATVRGEKVDGHDLIVQRYRRAEDIKNCEILFVSQSEARHLNRILAGLQGRSVLTVGDFDGFAKNGGMVRFVTEQNKIHIRINLATAKAANLNISSQLLRLAEIIQPGED